MAEGDPIRSEMPNAATISADILLPGLSTLCFKKIWKLCEVLNIRVTAGYRPAQTPEEPAGWMSISCFCLKSQNSFCKIESKFLNSRVLAGGFVMGCTKKS